MRKFIALSTLVVATSAMAQSTSTTEVKNKKLSFKERMSYSWYGQINDSFVANKNESQTRDVDFFHSFSINYQVNDNVTLSLNPTYDIVDAPAGSDDKFQEGDMRFRINGTYLHPRIWTSLSLIPNTTKDSIAANNSDGEIRFFNQMSTQFDHFNSLSYGFGLRKTLTKNRPGEQSLYRVLPYLSYKNTKFSETVAFRTDYYGSLRHVAGTSIGNMREDTGTGQSFNIGPSFSKFPILTSFFPYIAVYPSVPKAADQLGGGVQMFKSF